MGILDVDRKDHQANAVGEGKKKREKTVECPMQVLEVAGVVSDLGS